MINDERNKLQATILEREALRPISRFERLRRAPLRTLPYYALAALGHLKPFPITFDTLWGTKMTCYLPEGNTFYYYGYCEANLTNFFIRYVQEGMVVLDIGAHVGIYSMLASELVGSTGQIHSFEPTPRTFTLLKKNTEKLANVFIYNQAVAEIPGTLSFADYGAGYGAYNSASQAGAQDTSRVATTLTVPSITLDNYCQEKNITPTLIKIDAEGFEFEVLTGASSLLNPNNGNSRPLITIEVAGGSGWADNRSRSFEVLNSHNYLPFEIHLDGTVSPHHLQKASSYTYDNLLFIPSERVNEVISIVQ